VKTRGLSVIAHLVLLAAGTSAANPPSVDVPVQPAASVERALILEVIRAHRDEVRGCYEQLGTSPKPQGKVALELSIASSGVVSKSRVKESTVANAELEACVAAKAATWVFPKLKDGGGLVVTYPFVFKATESAEPVFRAGPRVDEGYRLMKDAVTSEQIGYAEVVGLRFPPRCLSKACSVQKEVVRLCSAFAEAGRRIDSGARYAEVVEPIYESTRAVCCDDVLRMLQAVGFAEDEDKYTIWCGVEDHDGDDGGTRARCGWPECRSFLGFWPKFRRQPPGWYETR